MVGVYENLSLEHRDLWRERGEGGVITITIYLDLSTWSYFYRRGHTHYPVSTFRPYIGEIAEKSK